VGTLDCDGSFPVLSDVQVGTFGDQVLPALVTLSHVSRLVADTGNLPALQSVSASLTLEGEGDLPALEYVSGGLVLIDVPELNAPSLLGIDRVVLRGSTATVLRDRHVGARWTVGWQRGTTAESAAVSMGVFLLDHDNTEAPRMHIGEAQGNLILRSNSWTSLDELSVEEVGGDLKYCLPSVPSEDLATWLDGVALAGAVAEDCS
jgi:hypothetical protein